MNNLARKSGVGLIQLIIGLSVFLFIPAWTMDFWQAWVYLLIFSVSIGLIFAYLYQHDSKLLERRLNRIEKQESQKHIQFYIFITYISIFILSSLDHRFSWSDVPFLVVMGGEVLVALGYYMIFLVLKENTFASATIELALDQKVIASGPYAIVRHPMYFGGIVMLLGTPLALGSWWGLLMMVPSVFIIKWRIFDEEKFLSKSLVGYNEYCQKVPYHLIPFIW